MQTLFFVSLHTLITSYIVIQLIIDTDCFLLTDANQSGHRLKRQPNSIAQFHDTLVKQDKVVYSGFRSRNKSRRISPALGHTKINRVRRYQSVKVQQQPPPQQYYYYSHVQSVRTPSPIPAPPFTADTQRHQVPLEQQKVSLSNIETHSQNTIIDKERLQNLEDVFRILARRNGPLLEQMLSLRDAIDRFYGIFEFMGVDEMSPPSREVAVTTILKRTLNTDTEKVAKKAGVFT